MIKFLSGGVLSQNPKSKRGRKLKRQRSIEKLGRWMENKIRFNNFKSSALNQSEAAKELKWHRATVCRHWSVAMRLLEAKGYIFRRAHDKSRAAKTHKRSTNAKPIWYGVHNDIFRFQGEFFEKTREGKCRHLRNTQGHRICGKINSSLSHFGEHIRGFVNKAQVHRRPCSAKLRFPETFQRKIHKTVWKLDRMLRALPWSNCKIDLLPTHTHALAKEAFKMRLSMEDVIKMANRELHKWHGIATDNGAEQNSLWLSTGWLADCRKSLNDCERFVPNTSKKFGLDKENLGEFQYFTPLPFQKSEIEDLSDEEIRFKILESLHSTYSQEKNQINLAEI